MLQEIKYWNESCKQYTKSILHAFEKFHQLINWISAFKNQQYILAFYVFSYKELTNLCAVYNIKYNLDIKPNGHKELISTLFWFTRLPKTNFHINWDTDQNFDSGYSVYKQEIFPKI